ncbi:MAG: glycosyltransferase family A protein [Bacteroidota bacterium]|nr:glycosyltransferase family A protein [Bacteroidota bacterium]
MVAEGISVLIPIYNVLIKNLVQNLHQQLLKINGKFEILLFDDGSQENFKNENRIFSDWTNVVYKELPQNIGRSKIRNKLALEATYKHLLFLDCDVSIVDKNYISNYLPLLNQFQIISGGTNYTINPPNDNALKLHWLAGSKKEQKTALERNKKPFTSFTINNLMIQKEVFLKYQLDESISTYGHEDSLFGYKIMENNISILHINNPVIHEGLNESHDYIKKSMTAVDNLCYIIKEYNIGKDTKLYQAYSLVRKLGLSKVFSIIIKMTENTIYTNLQSSNPSLILFDMVKLNRMIQFFTYTDTGTKSQRKF